MKFKIEAFLSYLNHKKLLITTHHPADIDGFVSSLLLKFFLEKHFKNPEILLYFSEYSNFNKKFISNFKEKFPKFNLNSIIKNNAKDFEVVVILDTNNLDQVEIMENFEILGSSIPFIFIDHHFNLNKKYDCNLNSLNIIFENYSSTAEIILEFYRQYNIAIPLPYKVLLIAAILTDSGFFKYGDNQTILNISDLLENNISFQDIITMLESDLDDSERIAKIKGLQRVELIKLGDWLLGISHVSSFSASVASMLISVGFDISIVYSEKNDEIIISTRAKKEVCQKTGLNLGKTLSEIGEGSAGGHEGAASLNGTLDLDVVLKKLIKKIKNILII